jgi:Tol biopolymer transport system component
MKRIGKAWLSVGVAVLAIALVPGAGAVQAKPLGTNGQIAFVTNDPVLCPDGCSTTFRINADGSHLQELLPATGVPHWSPDGIEVSAMADCSFRGGCGAVIVNVDAGTSRIVPNPDPARFNEFLGCVVWSPDGGRLACDAIGDAPGSTGIFSIRSSDGGDLTPILRCEAECVPLDYSPDGKRMVIALPDPANVENGSLYVLRVNGGGLRQITPPGVVVDILNAVASWSPTQDQIVFGAYPPGHRRALFVVNADGSGLRQLPIPGCGGSFADYQTSIACFEPSWSPDGTKVVFTRASNQFLIENIYTANVDGSDLTRITHNSQRLDVCCANWGTHPPVS